jgi:hypothetical protein
MADQKLCSEEDEAGSAAIASAVVFVCSAESAMKDSESLKCNWKVLPARQYSNVWFAL